MGLCQLFRDVHTNTGGRVSGRLILMVARPVNSTSPSMLGCKRIEDIEASAVRDLRGSGYGGPSDCCDETNASVAAAVRCSETISSVDVENRFCEGPLSDGVVPESMTDAFEERSFMVEGRESRSRRVEETADEQEKERFHRCGRRFVP